MEKDLSDFSKEVIRWIKKIPRGKIATYGQIAKLAGKPQGSRGVVWILHSSSKAYGLPWQRVLNSKGRIAFPLDSREFTRQKNLLKREGILVQDNGNIDLKVFLWNKKPRRAPSKTPRMFS